MNEPTLDDARFTAATTTIVAEDQSQRLACGVQKFGASRGEPVFVDEATE